MHFNCLIAVIRQPVSHITTRLYFKRSLSKVGQTNRVDLDLENRSRSLLHVYRAIQAKSVGVRSYSLTCCLGNNTKLWKMTERKPFSRLPTNVVPVNYVLRLQPDLEKFTFRGSEDITVEVKTATDTVVLNSADIKVQDAKYTSASGESKATVEYAADDETLTLKFPSSLPVGSGNLSLAFTGELNDKMKGFYRSTYTLNGEERHGAVTQFEATDARRAFPCWDEPAVKATFDVTLVVPKDRVALSNMPVIKDVPQEGDSNLKVVQYDRTPIMSTYLLAFVVGEYDYVEQKDSDGVLVRVYTPVGKKEQGNFALEVAVKTLPFYKKYFQIAYPLPKMDLIAIADFAAGAMENWGLVTYRETALLIDPENSSSAAKQWVALVVGHELAHQWFGNLVTMEWWTHLWLNEGFASFIEYLCVDHVFPDYDIWTQFVSTDFNRGMELDALANSHPIEVAVGHPAEVDEIFDAISYSKGASVIRMLHDYIGDESFRKGMKIYLDKFAYKNTFTEDLWEALGTASGLPVAKIMSTWTAQMGFPVLEVSQKQDGSNRVISIKQKKFCADGGDSGKSEWMVPISFSTSACPDKAVKKVLLDSGSVTVTLNNVQSAEWVKLNPGSVGFFRTRYSPEMLESLLPGIKDGSLPPRDRLGIENDLFALSRAGIVSAEDVLKVVEAFTGEESYTVWSDLTTNLAGLALIIQHTEHYASFKAFCRKLYGPIAAKLGWEVKKGESHLDAMLRGLVLGRLGRYHDAPIVEEAKKRFAAHCAGSAAIPADLRNAVYTTVLVNGGQEEYQAMLKLFKEADLHEEKVRLMRSLGAVKDEGLIKKVLEFSLSDDVRSQDTVFVIGGATGTVVGRELAWNFIQDKWGVLYKRYEGGFLLSRLIKFATDSFVTEEKAAEVEAFFKANKAPAAERTIQQSIENIHLNKAWLKRDKDAIKSFLA